MKKRALLVGINYVGSGYDLKGCINDANNMKAMLEQHGFTDITLLLENQATTANIKTGLTNLVTGSQAGDVLVFHYSGHGSQLPGTTEADGYEEIICPYDLDWQTKVITDEFLKSVFDLAPNGVNCTVILDCCHSGDGLNTATTDSIPVSAPVTNTVTVRRFLSPPDIVATALTGSIPVVWTASKDLHLTSMLVAACKSNQTSADAYINGVYQGAATYALLNALSKNDQISYRQLLKGMQDYMTSAHLEQTPELDGAESLKDCKFVEPWPQTVAPVIPVVTAPAPIVTVPSENKKDNTISIFVGILIVIAIVAFILI